MRLSVRTLLELVALVAIGLAFWNLAKQSRSPGPEIRALRHGDEGERIAALRELTLMGEDAAEAIPALLGTARNDPSLTARRGAMFALTKISILDPTRGVGSPLPIDSMLARGTTGAGAVANAPPTTPPTPLFPLLHPRSAEVAANLAEVMRIDPDPTIRRYALRALRRILEATYAERFMADWKLANREEVPEYPSSGGWVDALTRAIAERTRDPDPGVSGHAVGYISASKAAEALPIEERVAVLISAVEGERLHLSAELLAMNSAAQLMGMDHPDRDRLLALALARMEEPAELGDEYPMRGSGERYLDASRLAYGQIAWQLIHTADDLRERPEVADQLVPLLSAERGTDWVPIPEAGLATGLFERSRPLAAYDYSVSNQGRSTSSSGYFTDMPKAHESVLRVVVTDPRLLGDLWPRLDQRTRSLWLASHYYFGQQRPGGGWEQVIPVLSDASIRPDLPAERCEEILAQLLDEPEPEPGENDHMVFQALMPNPNSLTSGFGQIPGFPDAPGLDRDPFQSAREIRRVRSLVVMTYFARGASKGSSKVDVLVQRLREVLGSKDVSNRFRAVELLGSLGPRASAALPELDAMAGSEKETDTQGAIDRARRAIMAAEQGEAGR